MTMKWDGDALIGKVRAAAMRGVVRGTESVIEEGTSLILDTAKTGRVYRRRGVEHQASGPGEPPASDTGRLVQSARTEYDRSDIAGTAAWSTEYALPLEVGTSTMEPRPYARPALANRKDEIEEGIKAEVRGVLK